MKKTKGFTLIELLIVIAIIGILAAVVLIAINPIEMMRRGRDSQRLSDMTQLRKAIDLFVIDDPTTGLATAATDSSGGGRATDGSGWLPLDVSSTLATLPIDPTNAAGTASYAIDPAAPPSCDFYYFYSADAPSDTYELNTHLESRVNADKLTADGGNSDNVFEVGTYVDATGGLTLIPANPGNCL